MQRELHDQRNYALAPNGRAMLRAQAPRLANEVDALRADEDQV